MNDKRGGVESRGNGPKVAAVVEERLMAQQRQLANMNTSCVTRGI